MEDAKSKERKQPKNKIPLFSNLPLAFSSIFSYGVRANIQRAIPFWIALLFTGLIAVGYTKAFALH